MEECKQMFVRFVPKINFHKGFLENEAFHDWKVHEALQN